MSTPIQWCDETWNPVTGCSQIPGVQGRPSGCDHCYAKTLIDTRQSKNPQSPRYGHPFETVMLHEKRLDQPLKWKQPRRIFVNSLSDLFHVDVPDEFIERVFLAMSQAGQHTFQVLTKRPERMKRFVVSFIRNHGMFYLSGLQNVWFGVSISTNDDAWRADMLRGTPAAVRFLSVEPMLGPVDQVDLTGMDWVICGGESGKGARMMEPAWARDLRDRCNAQGTAFFFKQMGAEWSRDIGGDPHGSALYAIPEEFRIREFPRVKVLA